MKQLLLLLLGLSLAGTASAQTVTPSGDVERGISVSEPFSMPSVPTASGSEALPLSASPMAENIKLAYFNPLSQPMLWDAPYQVNQSLVVLQYSQRFTLPSNSGFVDSIRVRFARANGDTIYVFLVKDSLYELAAGDFHLMDLVSSGNLYGGIAIPVVLLPQIAVDGWVTIQFPHIAVPKEFHIMVSPRILVEGSSISATSDLRLVAENSTGTTPATETSRSNFVALTPQGQQLFSMDNYFSQNGEPVAVNFHMEAYVDVAQGTVAPEASAPARMYPNPIALNGTLTIEHPEQIASVRIVNILGNEMQSWNGMSSNVKLSIPDLPAGVYNVIVNTESGVTTEKLIVN